MPYWFCLPHCRSLPQPPNDIVNVNSKIVSPFPLHKHSNVWMYEKQETWRICAYVKISRGRQAAAILLHTLNGFLALPGGVIFRSLHSK